MLDHRDLDEVSLFTPENLLREARRQKSMSKGRIPRVCLLDPDGDIVRYLVRTRRAILNKSWACYHTEMYDYRLGDRLIGIVGNAVGSPFAVLVAEEMFASGCTLMLSLTSAGRISERSNLPRFLLISEALRDEGTSNRYLARGSSCPINAGLLESLSAALGDSPLPLGLGTSWTTDAPFRETASAIRRARKLGADCVEMEASALYAFAHARQRDVVCMAHVTNSMAQSKGDFEKGAEGGSIDSLNLVDFILRVLHAQVFAGRTPRQSKA
ncbi:MAG: nucleoside phosphorylase [Spirochaetia bacterium]